MDERKAAPNVIEQLAADLGGTIKEVGGPLSDGSGFAIMSLPLSKTHWIYQQGDSRFNVPPMPFRMGVADEIVIGGEILSRQQFADKIRTCGRYAVKCATMNGADMNFDPDALVQNLVVGMLGYWTADGLSSDEWANP